MIDDNEDDDEKEIDPEPVKGYSPHAREKFDWSTAGEGLEVQPGPEELPEPYEDEEKPE